MRFRVLTDVHHLLLGNHGFLIAEQITEARSRSIAFDFFIKNYINMHVSDQQEKHIFQQHKTTKRFKLGYELNRSKNAITGTSLFSVQIELNRRQKCHNRNIFTLHFLRATVHLNAYKRSVLSTLRKEKRTDL